MYNTDDLDMQGFTLTKISQLIDSMKIRSPLTETLYGLTVRNIQKAHIKQESGTMVGKQAIVISQ